jgi:receptor protein-tyrosine kinase
VDGLKGLSDYLTDTSVAIGDVMVRIADGPVFVPAGQVRVRNASELLGSRRMRQFCSELERAFPQAIFLYDSPPVLPTPDAMALVQWLDGAIFVASAGKTSRKALADGVRQFGANRVVGIVVNRSDLGASGYPYRYYYYYRYGSDSEAKASDGS